MTSKWNSFVQALARRKTYVDDPDEDDLPAIQSNATLTTLVGTPTTQTGDYSGDAAKHSGGEAVLLTGEAPKLARVLGLMDLTMLGVGATLGVGVYVLAGSVARNQAGPSVVISFAIAAIASLFSGFCYSEFASRISKAGSAYNYTYLSIGEFAAYIIGWNMVLEYIIGTASEAKAISNQIDSLLGNAYENAMTRMLPIRSSFLSTYPDFIAPVFVFLITGLLSWGARESTKVNNALTFINLGTVGVIVLTGMFRLNPANWAIRKADIPAGVRNAGSGGFAPFGVAGIVTGAAKCFFGFVGFDGISTTGEETRNPKRNIPLAIILSLLIVFVCYFSIALVITMIIPYYDQNPDAPFPAIFDRLGWPIMKWAVTTGSLIALFTAMFGAFFPLPRILYSMSRDGLLYQLFCYVSPRTQTPIISTAVSGMITAIMSAVFKLDQLVDMMSIGTLLAYIIVAVCVLLLRYSKDEEDEASSISSVGVETLGKSYKDEADSQLYTNMEHISESRQVEKESIWNQSAPNFVNDTKLPKSHFQEKTGTDFPLFQTKPMADGFSKTVNDDEDFVSITKRETAKLRADALARSSVYSISHSDAHTADVNGQGAIANSVFQTKTLSKLKQILHHLFNTENLVSVTASSERVSKVCIYLLIALTIFISFLLNSVTSVNVEDPPSYRNTLNASLEAPVNSSHLVNSTWDVKALNGSLERNRYTMYSLHTAPTQDIHPHTSNINSHSNIHSLTLGSFLHQQLGNSRAVAFLKNAAQLDSAATDKIRYFCYVFVVVAYTVTFTVLARQGQNTRRLKFKVPFVPLVPCVSIFMNIYLMINLDISTWVRLLVWLAIGMMVYFSYGIFNSKQKKT